MRPPRHSAPARHAAAASEAIRALNHATLEPDGLEFPSDAYDVVASLWELAHRLPQALGQLQTFLAREAEAGRLRIVAGEHVDRPDEALALIAYSLGTASGHAVQLGQALGKAQAALTWAASCKPA
jgi:hypothetical protein